MTYFHIGNSDFLWYEFFNEAEYALDIKLNDDVKVYVISLISSNTDIEFLDDIPLGIAYLESQDNFKEDKTRLKHVADKCLLLAGMFPEHAFKRNVTPDYFANLAVTGYFQLSGLGSPNKGRSSSLYSSLAFDFYDVVKVVFYMRCCSRRMELPSSIVDLRHYCNGSYNEVTRIFIGRN